MDSISPISFKIAKSQADDTEGIITLCLTSSCSECIGYYVCKIVNYTLRCRCSCHSNTSLDVLKQKHCSGKIEYKGRIKKEELASKSFDEIKFSKDSEKASMKINSTVNNVTQSPQKNRSTELRLQCDPPSSYDLNRGREIDSSYSQ